MEKNIKVDEEIWKKLQEEKLKEGYNKISDIIKNKIDFVEKFSNEKEFSDWFEENYKLLGFSKIIEKRKFSYPDFKMEMDGKELEVELETLSSNFIRHKHDPEKCDIVLCLLNDKKLPIKTIEITSFEYLIKFTSIRVNAKLWEDFKIWCIKNKVSMSEKLEEVIKEIMKK